MVELENNLEFIFIVGLLKLFLIKIFSFLYEFFSEKRVWRNYLGRGGINIYNLMHSKKYNFF